MRCGPPATLTPSDRVDWNDVRLFLAIARTGTLSAAAPGLDLSQPTAGRRLRAFEASVGATLFHRTPGGLKLTGDGEAVLLHAERVEQEMLGLARRAAADSRDLGGELRISTSEWFAQNVLVEPLLDFVRDHPSVTIELVAETRLLDLDRREADLVFRFQPFDSADIVQRRFVRVGYGLFASRAYLDRYGAPSLANEGENHRLVAMDTAHNQLADIPWITGKLPRATFAFRSNSRDMQALACARGAGISVLPRVLAGKLDLVEIDLGEAPPHRDVWMGYHQDLRKLGRLRAVLDHLEVGVPRQI